MRYALICGAIFLILLWALGVYFGFLGGVKTLTPPSLDTSGDARPAHLEEQRKIAEDTEEQERRIKQDYQFQMQQYKNRFPSSPSGMGSSGF